MALRREKAGAFVSEWRNFDSNRAKLLWENGFRWLAFQAHAGGNAPPVGHIPGHRVQEFRNMGFEVGGWGAFESHNDPKHCAWAANGIIEPNLAEGWPGYQFYIANIEIPFNDKAFVDEFRKWRPAFTLWLSTMLTDPRDWDTWYGDPPRSTCWMPQTYMNQNTGWTPMEALFWATRPRPPGHGIPATFVKPTIGLWDIPGKARFPINQYIDALDATGKPGFSIWLGETALESEIRALGAAIQTKGIALL